VLKLSYKIHVIPNKTKRHIKLQKDTLISPKKLSTKNCIKSHYRGLSEWFSERLSKCWVRERLSERLGERLGERLSKMLGEKLCRRSHQDYSCVASKCHVVSDIVGSHV
jgi:hypothetical protein